MGRAMSRMAARFLKKSAPVRGFDSEEGASGGVIACDWFSQSVQEANKMLGACGRDGTLEDTACGEASIVEGSNGEENEEWGRWGERTATGEEPWGGGKSSLVYKVKTSGWGV